MFSYFIELAEKVALQDTVSAGWGYTKLNEDLSYDYRKLSPKFLQNTIFDNAFKNRLITTDQDIIAAIETKYIKNQPITVDRVWRICLRYLEGSRYSIFSSDWGMKNAFQDVLTVKEYNNEKSKKPVNPLSIFYFPIKVIQWLFNSIPIRRGIVWGLNNGSNLVAKIFLYISKLLFGIVGAAFGVIAGILNKFVHPDTLFSTSIQTGMNFGRKYGEGFSKSIGYILGGPLGFLTGVVVGCTASCAIGATTIIVGTLKVAKFLGFGTLLSYLNPFNNDIETIHTSNPDNSNPEINKTLNNHINDIPFGHKFAQAADEETMFFSASNILARSEIEVNSECLEQNKNTRSESKISSACIIS